MSIILLASRVGVSIAWCVWWSHRCHTTLMCIILVFISVPSFQGFLLVHRFPVLYLFMKSQLYCDITCSCHHTAIYQLHDDDLKWKRFPHYWSFESGIQRSHSNPDLIMFSLLLNKLLSWWCFGPPWCSYPRILLHQPHKGKSIKYWQLISSS